MDRGKYIGELTQAKKEALFKGVKVPRLGLHDLFSCAMNGHGRNAGHPTPPVGESTKGTSPSAALRTGRKPLDLSGSHHSTLSCKPYFPMCKQSGTFLT